MRPELSRLVPVKPLLNWLRLINVSGEIAEFPQRIPELSLAQISFAKTPTDWTGALLDPRNGRREPSGRAYSPLNAGS
jgi:hypothetical protein